LGCDLFHVSDAWSQHNKSWLKKLCLESYRQRSWGAKYGK
jgi:hypothetical protein